MNKYYIVYNIVNFNESIDNFDSLNINLYELYSLLLSSSNIVAIEFHVDQKLNTREFRVIWWSEQSYNDWAKINSEKYNKIVENFASSVCNNTQKFEFLRLTSNDSYISKFPYTDYPYKNKLIDWVCIPYYIEWIAKHILPVGKITNYLGQGIFDNVENFRGECARFIKERSSDIIRRQPSAAAMQGKSFPSRLIAYSIEQAIMPAMYETPWLYRKLLKLNYEVEQIANEYITDCDNAAVLIGHTSLGQELTLHTHRITDPSRYSLTIAVRLSFIDSGVKFKFYDHLDMDDEDINKYYANMHLLYNLLENKDFNHITLKERTSVIVFPASYIPHSVEYNNDLYFYYVYDNVNFKPNKFEEIVEKSTQTYFSNLDENSRLYFFNYQ